MGIDLIKKSSRLLASRRYTTGGFSPAQEAFTQVLDLGSNEIYSETNAIPSIDLPFSGSSQQRNTTSVTKYYYRHALTKASSTNEVWFFLDPTGSNSGIGTQLIDANQKTNFISPKYSIPGLAQALTEDPTPGYGVTVLVSTSRDSGSLDFNSIVNSNFYQFDYKTGVLQFTDDDIPTDSEYVYMTAYQYTGKTVTDVSSSLSTRVTNLESTSSNRKFNHVTASGNISASGYISASNIRTSGDGIFGGNIAVQGGTIFGLGGFGITIDDISLTTGSNQFGSASNNLHGFTGSVSVTGSVTADSYTGIFNGALSSSTQIGTEISGAFVAASHSLQSRINSLSSNLTFTSDMITGSFVESSHSLQLRINAIENGQITTLPSGLISGSDHIFSSITASGNISASGKLFASLSAVPAHDNAILAVVYDSGSGQFFTTGSYGTGTGTTGGGEFGSVGENLLPDNDDSRDLGSPIKRWSALYAVDTFFGGIHEINLETIGISQLQTGTVLVSKAGQMVPCDTKGDALVMGIASSGSNYPIVMGAEPVLVDGAVYEGDYIITSDRIGYGTAIPPDQIYDQKLFGKIIAQSLETNIKGGTIKAMIRKM